VDAQSNDYRALNNWLKEFRSRGTMRTAQGPWRVRHSYGTQNSFLGWDDGCFQDSFAWGLTHPIWNEQ